MMLVQVTAFSVKSGLYIGLSRHSHRKCHNKAAICWAVRGLGIKWLASFRSSAGASWWSHIPNCSGSATGCLRVFPFTKPRILCWRVHSLITCCDKCINLQLWKSRLLFSFLMRIVILNKKFLKKQIWITHSYFPINLRNIQTGTANVWRQILSCEACFEAGGQHFKILLLNNVTWTLGEKGLKFLVFSAFPCDKAPETATALMDMTGGTAST